MLNQSNLCKYFVIKIFYLFYKITNFYNFMHFNNLLYIIINCLVYVTIGSWSDYIKDMCIFTSMNTVLYLESGCSTNYFEKNKNSCQSQHLLVYAWPTESSKLKFILSVFPTFWKWH